ncbi:hypothetical protein DAPPUDRAFT_206483 [Daphnia pulex]|uniref:Phenylalanine--tRNA ligase, mitochondrial n=1 Tax=Daphnia pulex TaxID=6669 RepID=E9FUM1_DAPPU|nr:hypothetical protein DAPPUDRAFT_206483 [Daphnia pulex]|eukprot:EFX88755.1 hypothetical protein DAPPUDRAFT_206483 [Daphnia pulex]
MTLLRKSLRFFAVQCRNCASKSSPNVEFTASTVDIDGRKFNRDKWTNVNPNILKYLNRNLHLKPGHPLCLLRENIISFMYKSFPNHAGNPIFSVFDRLNPIVTTKQNFDSLLIPQDHPSRTLSDCYYLNKDFILRGHTSSHQEELIASGLDSFVVMGDVYRRDEIDASHFPVFHQAEGVRLFAKHQLHDIDKEKVELFENGKRTPHKQEHHTELTSDKLQHELKTCLTKLVHHLFGNDVETRWTETYFPFTHPSFELEVKFQDKWLELLGCGVIEQQILYNAGVPDKVGWAFGLGLERIAMRLYEIPDIRLFWSNDSGFLSQFQGATPNQKITYKSVSQYPQCFNDVSFWLPEGGINSSDVYEIVRGVGGDIVEQVRLVDEFLHPKTKKRSQCFRIIYRHMERTLTQAEVGKVHERIKAQLAADLGVTLR